MAGSKNNWTRNSTVHRDVDLLLEGFLDYTTGRLSSITRYNTRKAIIKQSVLEHSGGVTLIAMALSDYLNSKGIRNNTERVLRMAIIHDADEVVSGDVPYEAKYTQGTLSENLRKALHEIGDYNIDIMLRMIGNREVEKKYKMLFEEEKWKKTLESRIVKLADTAEAIIYCRQEERIGNKGLAEVHKRQIVNFHRLLDEVLKEQN